MKKFVKEIIANATLLSALILLPMTFRGPGWRPRESEDNFARSHQNINESSKFAPEEAKDSYDKVLHAIPRDR